jgi:hypothetical protein
MATKFGPWVCPGVIDVGRLMDVVARDVASAKARSRQEVVRLFEGIKAAHADWLKGHNLSGKALRRAGTPFSEAYDDVECWLTESAPRKRQRKKLK